MTPGIVGESDLSGNLTDEYVFFDGERVARKSTNGVFYYFADNLKTASVVTDALGNIKSESDFYPWGGELQFVNNDSNHYKFTSKERDTETGLDYFGTRYYGNALGRFLTPDKPFADQHFQAPQSWNLYMYVYNNPLRLVDDTGQGARPADDQRVQQVLNRPENFTINKQSWHHQITALGPLSVKLAETLFHQASSAWLARLKCLTASRLEICSALRVSNLTRPEEGSPTFF